eukprot:749790-Hanusia_phi.AAC.1
MKLAVQVVDRHLLVSSCRTSARQARPAPRLDSPGASSSSIWASSSCSSGHSAVHPATSALSGTLLGSSAGPGDAGADRPSAGVPEEDGGGERNRGGGGGDWEKRRKGGWAPGYDVPGVPTFEYPFHSPTIVSSVLSRSECTLISFCASAASRSATGGRLGKRSWSESEERDDRKGRKMGRKERSTEVRRSIGSSWKGKGARKGAEEGEEVREDLAENVTILFDQVDVSQEMLAAAVVKLFRLKVSLLSQPPPLPPHLPRNLVVDLPQVHWPFDLLLVLLARDRISKMLEVFDLQETHRRFPGASDRYDNASLLLGSPTP